MKRAIWIAVGLQLALAIAFCWFAFSQRNRTLGRRRFADWTASCRQRLSIAKLTAPEAEVGA